VVVPDNAINGIEAEASTVELDVVMPVVGGGETLAALRRNWPGLPVLITSGYNREEAIRFGSLPADLLFLEKPFTAQRLDSAVREALQPRTVA
jgi:DNA-binding NtrC family response regulator